jgi:hypothetical protein
MNKLLLALRNPKRAYSYMQKKIGASEFRTWEAREFAPPSPSIIKQACVLRNGLKRATWVETGTYLGETTRKLAQVGEMVYSIEAEPTLFANAQTYFQGTKNVEIINGLSEEVMPNLLPKLRGDVCFWLDAHFSGGRTHRGPLDTPISKELDSIGANLGTMRKVVVMVDDIRFFSEQIHREGAYPTLNELVDWVRKHRLSWHIEHDIFIAKNH